MYWPRESGLRSRMNRGNKKASETFEVGTLEHQMSTRGVLEEYQKNTRRALELLV